MGSFQGGRWSPRQLGVAAGGFAGAGLRDVTRRLAQDMAAQRSVTKRGRLITAQTEMTGSSNLSATDYITETGIWLVTAHATVRTLSSAAGRLETVISDIGAPYPSGPSPRHDVVLGGGEPDTDYEMASFIAISDPDSPISIGGRYYPDTGTVDEAWLVWRAFRLD